MLTDPQRIYYLLLSTMESPISYHHCNLLIEDICSSEAATRCLVRPCSPACSLHQQYSTLWSRVIQRLRFSQWTPVQTPTSSVTSSSPCPCSDPPPDSQSASSRTPELVSRLDIDRCIHLKGSNNKTTVICIHKSKCPCCSREPAAAQH